jgi:sucrose-6-phosphate hydrolase SacC (GH32 family)
MLVDCTSVELFVADGQLVLTDQVFPRQPLSQLSLYARGGDIRIKSCELWEMMPIWNS